MTDFDNIFSVETTIEPRPPSMGKDEFIAKAKSVLRAIMDGYSSHWSDKFD
jgi:hypothetical protein